MQERHSIIQRIRERLTTLLVADITILDESFGFRIPLDDPRVSYVRIEATPAEINVYFPTGNSFDWDISDPALLSPTTNDVASLLHRLLTNGAQLKETYRGGVVTAITLDVNGYSNTRVLRPFRLVGRRRTLTSVVSPTIG